MSQHSTTKRMSPWWTMVDRFIGIVLALIALTVIVNMWNSHLHFWDLYGPGPSFFPYGLAVIMLAISIPLILSKKRVDIKHFGDSPSATFKYIITVGLLAWLFPLLGALLSISIFSFLVLMWVERYPFRQSLIATVAIVIVVWVVFYLILSVPFPSGPFELPELWR